MSIGDKQDIYNRLITQLPTWFGPGNNSPILDAFLQSYIETAFTNYNQVAYAELQTRINNYTISGVAVPDGTSGIVFGATGQQLDIISIDYLGNNLPREAGESDASFRKRILSNILRPKCTRQAMYDALINMQDVDRVFIFEPENYFDVGGGYNSISPSSPFFMAYGSSSDPDAGRGRYGSGAYAYQCFIDVYINPQGMANSSGYNDNYGGYNSLGPLTTAPPPVIYFYYGGESDIQTPTTAAMIYRTINLTKVFGTICWVSLHFVTNT